MERAVHKDVGDRVRIVIGGFSRKGSIPQRHPITVWNGTHGKVDTAALDSGRVGDFGTSIHRCDRRTGQLLSPQHERIATIDIVMGGHMTVGVHDQHSRKALSMDIFLDQTVVDFRSIRRQECRKRLERSIQIVRSLGFSSLFISVIFFAGVF